MRERVIKLPDVGEGVAEAELVEWRVRVGDLVREDSILAAVMTDKATVEIPSPADGEVLWLGAEVGDAVAVGSPLIKLKVAGEAEAGEGRTPAEPERAAPAPPARAATKAAAPAPVAIAKPHAPPPRRLGAARPSGEKPVASPAVRLRAREAGVDLRQVAGSGPAGRISHADLDGFIAHGAPAPAEPGGLGRNTAVEEVRIAGLRRRIAEKMALANARVAPITYIEEVDVTALEELRATLNRQKRPDQPKLTLLPFLMRAMVKAIAAQPDFNALYDDDAGVLRRHGGVHIGVAAQTPAGLVVPVVRHVEARDLWDCAGEVARLAAAAKSGAATREELSGSTITITSLGAMGGIATTPIVNYPEVAIVGVNKIMIRPVWDGAGFAPRKVMNLSSSFDHRVIDGWDAAAFVQRVKTLMETPAMIFVAG